MSVNPLNEFLSEENIISNYPLHGKLNIQKHGNIVELKLHMKYFCRLHNLNLPNEYVIKKYIDCAGQGIYAASSVIEKLDTYKKDTLRYGEEQWSTNLVPHLVFNTKKQIHNPYIFMDNSSLAFIMPNIKIDTLEYHIKYYEKFRKDVYVECINRILRSAAEHQRRDVFEYIVKDVKSKTLRSKEVIKAVLENKWHDFLHLFQNDPIHTDEVLSYLTFDEMLKYDFHTYQSDFKLPGEREITQEKDVFHFHFTASAIIDEKNIKYYGYRLLQEIINIDPNNLKLYKNAYFHNGIIYINDKMTLETYKFLKSHPCLMFVVFDVDNACKEILLYKKRIVQLAVRYKDYDFERLTDVGSRACKYCDIDLKYYLCENPKFREGSSYAVNNIAYMNNVRFLLIALRLDKKIRNMQKFNYNIWYNVYRKLTLCF